MSVSGQQALHSIATFRSITATQRPFDKQKPAAMWARAACDGGGDDAVCQRDVRNAGMGLLWVQGNADGAYFGTTFPHLLLMTYPSLRPPPASDSYVPRVFGFKLHPSALGREPVDAAGPSDGGIAGPSAAAAQGNNNAPRGAAGASTSAPAGGVAATGDRRGKRREDQQQHAAGGGSVSRTIASMDGDGLDGRQEMDIMRPR